jgi:ParB family transcriptional regulator, chromosome partitioning protein
MNDVPAPKKRPSGLGRGLSALMGEIEQEAPVSVGGTAGTGGASIAAPEGVRMVETGQMRPMPGQPRRHFDDGALDELARSIEARGLLQPILVRAVVGGFEIIAGERRWRAAQRANIHQVPVIIREFDDKTALEIALVENVQREALSAWEEGETYRRLIEEHGHIQEGLAKIVGKSRSHIANLMRLRNLPQVVHDALTSGALTMGHARALLVVADPEALAQQVIARRLSVRETEKLANQSKRDMANPKPRRESRDGSSGNADIAALERQLSDMLGLKTRIAHQNRAGSVTLQYSSLEQLDMICQRLSGEPI